VRGILGDITSVLEDEAIQAIAGNGEINPGDLHLDRGHPLLASWGKTGREFQRLVTDLQMVNEEVEDFRESAQSDLLGQVQRTILNLEDRPTGEPLEVSRADRSIQIHNCHSPLRELQVFRDHLLEWFASDPTLSPQDILVLLPDVAAYAPFIKGVFDNAERDRPPFPTRSPTKARGRKARSSTLSPRCCNWPRAGSPSRRSWTFLKPRRCAGVLP